LFRLFDQIVGDGHGNVVEARGSRDEDPVSGNDGARITNLFLELGARVDVDSVQVLSPVLRSDNGVSASQAWASIISMPRGPVKERQCRPAASAA
jgi:hypothetical protein